MTAQPSVENPEEQFYRTRLILFKLWTCVLFALWEKNHIFHIYFIQVTVAYTCIKVFTTNILFYNWATSWENQCFAYAKKTQISFAVTAKLISAFVFATWIVQCLYFLNTKFQASSHLQWLYSLVCVRLGQNPYCWFSHVAAHISIHELLHEKTCLWDFKTKPACYVREEASN